jgi:hypothetical protein
MHRNIIIVILLVCLPSLAYGQLKSQGKPVDMAQELRTSSQAAGGIGGIIGLDPSKIHFSHSYSMSYFSFNGQSFAQGLYLNTIDYEFSAPLTMRLQWGFAHAPLANFGAKSVLGNGPFISAAELQYRPSEKFSIGVEYRALPSYYRSGPYGARYFWDEEQR